jgi:uncharacterized protein
MKTTAESSTRSTRSQKLIAVGAIVALAILAVQAYVITANGSLNTTGIHTASGATDPSSNSTVTVTGSGQVDVQPTLALLTIGVNTQGQSAESAAQQNAATMTKIISALESLGISNSSIQTISYNIYQQQNYAQPIVVCSTPNNDTAGCPWTGNGFEVDNEVQVNISVTTQNVSQLGAKVGAAIDAAVAQGANEVYGVQFTATSSAIQTADQQALKLAVQDADGQAKSIASALGLTISGVVSVTTNPSYTPVGVTPDAISSSQTPVVAPQSLTVSASVEAVFSLS